MAFEILTKQDLAIFKNELLSELKQIVAHKNWKNKNG